MKRTKKIMYPLKSRNISKYNSSHIKPNKEFPSRKMHMKVPCTSPQSIRWRQNNCHRTKKRLRRLTKLQSWKANKIFRVHTHKNMSSIKSACYTIGNLGAKKLVSQVSRNCDIVKETHYILNECYWKFCNYFLMKIK